MHLHAEHTVILDLSKSEDELLKDMRRQTRYEVRRSIKLGLEVSWSNTEELLKSSTPYKPKPQCTSILSHLILRCY